MGSPFLQNTERLVLKKKLSVSALNKITRVKLNTVASALGLKPEHYKTKRDLYEKMWEWTNDLPSIRCSNKTDPVTLDNIDDIPKDRLFEWDQNGKHWGADLTSLNNLIETGNTRLPWSIDTASGIEASEDPENYSKKYEFSETVKKEIKQKAQNCGSSDVSFIDVPERSHLRFYIENLAAGDMYITHIIDFIEQINYKNLVEYLHYCLMQLWEYIRNGIDEDAENNIKTLHIVEYVFTNILRDTDSRKRNRKLEGLRLVCHIFEIFKHNLEYDRFEDVSRLFLLQMDNSLSVEHRSNENV